jgi:hypothetical protein
MIKEKINNGCEFQSDCIEYKDISYLKVMPICAIHELSIACYDKENKCKYYQVYKQLKRLQKENEELKANKGRCAFKCLDNTFCDEAKIRIDKLELDKDCLKASLETARKYRGIAETDRDKYKQALEEIREKLKKYDANIGDTIIANPIQDCYDTYKLINEVLNDRD